MNTTLKTANIKSAAIPLNEVIPFWFAFASPLIGVLIGLLGAWFVTWLNM